MSHMAISIGATATDCMHVMLMYIFSHWNNAHLILLKLHTFLNLINFLYNKLTFLF